MDRERRRSSRVPALRGSRGQLRSTVDVDILDLSSDGLRLELSTSLRPGAVYDLKADLGGYPLAVQVRITRCNAGGFRDDGKGGRFLLFRAGAEILWTDVQPKKLLEQHLERAKERGDRPASSPGILRYRG
jgi:hypothetical protein